MKGQTVFTDVRGFSLVELLVTAGVVVTLASIGAFVITSSLTQYRLDGAARAVAGQIRAARLTAVTTNRIMRVRFGCPAGFSRAIEFTGDTAIDNAGNRCSAPWPDPDPNTLPNVDGPPLALPQGVTFTATQDLQIDRLGRVTPLSGGAPAVIQVTNGAQSRQITVSIAGRIQAP